MMKSDAADRPPQTLQTVERALSFLEIVATCSSPPTVREVSERLDLNLTTCYHLMRTLLVRRYLERRDDGTLRLGVNVGALFRAYQLGFDINEHLSSVVSVLSDRTAETAFLSVLEGRNVILRVLVEGSQPLRVAGLYVGLAGNEVKRASGKAVLAYADPTIREAAIEQHRSEVGPESDADDLMARIHADLAEVRNVGWAIDTDHSPGIVSIGAPFFDDAGAVFGAVGLVVPSTRWVANRNELLDSVLMAAQAATRRLGVGTD